MKGTRKVDALEVVYGALIGGLISSFVGVAVFSVFLNDTSSSSPPIAAAVTGLVCSALLMVGGMLVADRTPWLGTSLLFGSGFTALWSVALSVSIEQRWFTLLILGVVILAGLWLGKRRFGSAAEPAVSDTGAREEPGPAGADGE